MKIIAIEQELPAKSAKDFQPYLKAEALKVWELVQTGIIREIYFRDDEPHLDQLLLLLLNTPPTPASC